jgi:hypothetical protein
LPTFSLQPIQTAVLSSAASLLGVAFFTVGHMHISASQSKLYFEHDQWCIPCLLLLLMVVGASVAMVSTAARPSPCPSSCRHHSDDEVVHQRLYEHSQKMIQAGLQDRARLMEYFATAEYW